MSIKCGHGLNTAPTTRVRRASILFFPRPHDFPTCVALTDYAAGHFRISSLTLSMWGSVDLRAAPRFSRYSHLHRNSTTFSDSA